jgi:hypothetical protein
MMLAKSTQLEKTFTPKKIWQPNQHKNMEIGVIPITQRGVIIHATQPPHVVIPTQKLQ